MLPIVNWNENPDDFPSVSVTLVEPDSPVLRERISRTFDGVSVDYLGAGFNNAHHRVRTKDGNDAVLRRALAPVPALRARLRREHAVLSFLAKNDYRHSPRIITELLETSVDACPGYLMTYVDGVQWSGTAEQARALGKAVASLHRLSLNDVPAAAGAQLTPMKIVDRLCRRLERNIEEVGPQMSAGHRDAAAGLILDLPRRLAALDWTDSRPVLVHGDLGDHNVRFVDDRAVLIDWEFAAVADPLFDLMWFAARDGVWANHLADFFAGYANPEFEGRVLHLRWLRDLALVELALWAQSGLNDIAAGVNRHFFRADDVAFLARQVARLDEAIS